MEERVVSVQETNGRYTVTHSRSGISATETDRRFAFQTLLLKLEDYLRGPFSNRSSMKSVGVDRLEGILKDGAIITRRAVEQGYIEAHVEEFSCTDIPPSDWLDSAMATSEVFGGEIHQTIAGVVEAILRGHGYNIIKYETDAHYSDQPGGMRADLAIPNAGTYIEVAGHNGGGLSDNPDKIASCLDVGRHPIRTSQGGLQLAKSPHIYDNPPLNPVEEIIYIPWCDAVKRIEHTTDVKLPLWVFRRTNKKLPDRTI